MWAIMRAAEGVGGGGTTEVEAPTPAPTPEPLAPAPEPPTPPVEEKLVGEVEPPAPTPLVEPAPASKPDWKEQRIAKLTAQLAEYRRVPPTSAPLAGDSPAVFEARVSEEADRRTRIASFNEKCNEAVEVGRVAFPDFNAKVDSLKKLVDENDPASVAAYTQFLTAAIETGEASKLIYTAGSDLNEAMRIMSLPPLTMAVELTRLASKEIVDVSGAPRPIVPVGGKGQTKIEIDPADPERADNLPKVDWFARRQAQVDARREARGR